MDAWEKCVLSARKPMSIKFLVLGGGYFGFFLGGGGGADFIFMGARIFLTILELFYQSLDMWGPSKVRLLHGNQSCARRARGH